MNTNSKPEKEEIEPLKTEPAIKPVPEIKPEPNKNKPEVPAPDVKPLSPNPEVIPFKEFLYDWNHHHSKLKKAGLLFLLFLI
jgi:hypothetical protein